MKLDIILTKFRHFELVILGFFCIVGYGVCIIYFSFGVQWIFLKLSMFCCGHNENAHVGF